MEWIGVKVLKERGKDIEGGPDHHDMHLECKIALTWFLEEEFKLKEHDLCTAELRSAGKIVFCSS